MTLAASLFASLWHPMPSVRMPCDKQRNVWSGTKQKRCGEHSVYAAAGGWVSAVPEAQEGAAGGEQEAAPAAAGCTGGCAAAAGACGRPAAPPRHGRAQDRYARQKSGVQKKLRLESPQMMCAPGWPQACDAFAAECQSRFLTYYMKAHSVFLI